MVGKRENSNRYRDSNIDAHHAAMGPFGEFPSIIAILSKNDWTIGKRIAIHKSQAFFKIFNPFHPFFKNYFGLL